MEDMKQILAYASLLTLLCPGLIFVYAHTVVATGKPPAVSKDNLASFIAVSTIYTVVMTAFGMIPKSLFSKDFLLSALPLADRLKIVAFAFVLPAFLGLFYSAAKQRDLVFIIFKRLGLRPVYPAPTAWDTIVKRILIGDFVIATLKDGRKISGNIDEFASFSSKDDCYDMLISETDSIPGQAANVIRSTWIASGEVQTLEIVSAREQTNDQENEAPDTPKPFYRKIT